MNQIFGSDGENQNNGRKPSGGKNPFLDFSQTQNYYYEDNVNQFNNQNYYSNVGNKKDIVKIARFFCIFVFIFGLCLIGKSIYTFTMGREKITDNPELSAEQIGKEVIITVNTTNPIKEFRYSWKGESPAVVQGTGTDEFQKTIEIPMGNNILDMTVIDCYGSKTEFQKQYIFESDDVTKPNIELASTGKEILITATDDKTMEYLTYQWNDDEETRVEAEENSNKIEQKIEVAHGKNKLKIMAYDSTGNRQVKEETIIGDDKPELNISIQDNKVVVKANDDEGIKKIAITIDGETTDTGDESLNRKEVTAKKDISNGNHKIVVVVTNINNLEATKELSASN